MVVFSVLSFIYFSIRVTLASENGLGGSPSYFIFFEILWGTSISPAVSAEATVRRATGAICFRYTSIPTLLNSSSIFFWSKLLFQILYLLSPRVTELGWPRNEGPRKPERHLEVTTLEDMNWARPMYEDPTGHLLSVVCPDSVHSLTLVCVWSPALPSWNKGRSFCFLKRSVLAFTVVGSFSSNSLAAWACRVLILATWQSLLHQLAGAANLVCMLQATSCLLWSRKDSGLGNSFVSS